MSEDVNGFGFYGDIPEYIPLVDSYGAVIKNDSWVETYYSTGLKGFIVVSGSKKYILAHYELSCNLKLDSSIFKVTPEKLEYLEQMRKDGKIVQII